MYSLFSTVFNEKSVTTIFGREAPSPCPSPASGRGKRASRAGEGDRFFIKSYIIAIGLALAPGGALACACGCGVFDVGTGAMLPTQPGGMAWLEYNFMNQERNWHGSASAPAADNSDRKLKSQFYTGGMQYMFDRDWGARITVPVTERHFVSLDSDTGELGRFDHTGLGDMRVQGIYSGFSPDMSSGITFGAKLPSGNYRLSGLDRDTAIGTGSTDVLLGAYHQGHLVGQFNWFANGEWDQPVLITAGYRPGAEGDAAAGVYYNGWRIGSLKIAPLAQMVGSWRLHDRGPAADPANSGYRRLLLSPGVELDAAAWRLYGDVGFPAYQHVRGDQIVAGRYYTLNLSYSF